MALVDKTGRLVRFTIRPGNAAENLELPTLLEGLAPGEVIADKAYDTNAIRLDLASAGITATIPPKRNRKEQPWYDPLHYRTRHLVENFFADLKQYRGIATRYCKLGENYRAFINLAGWFLETKTGRRTEKAPVYKEKPPKEVEGQMPLAVGPPVPGFPGLW
jgi:transposase